MKFVKCSLLYMYIFSKCFYIYYFAIFSKCLLYILFCQSSDLISNLLLYITYFSFYFPFFTVSRGNSDYYKHMVFCRKYSDLIIRFLVLTHAAQIKKKSYCSPHRSFRYGNPGEHQYLQILKSAYSLTALVSTPKS